MWYWLAGNAGNAGIFEFLHLFQSKSKQGSLLRKLDLGLPLVMLADLSPHFSIYLLFQMRVV